MVEVLGMSASIVGLISVTFSIIQEIRTARDRVKGTSKTLQHTSDRLEQLERTLHLVQEQEALRTTHIREQLVAICEAARDLRAFFDRLAAIQGETRFSRFRRALKSGDKDDRELEKIMSRIDRERDELTLRISVANVGLTGDLHGGMRVAFGVIQETNEKVKQLGVREVEVSSLEVMNKLEDMRWRRSDVGGDQQRALIPNRQLVPERKSEAGRVLQLEAGETDVSSPRPHTDANSRYPGYFTAKGNSISDNIAVGQLKAMTGNLGMEAGHVSSVRNTVVTHNRAGKDMMIMAGDVGGQAAGDFIQNFWGR
ncbi:hypothetical protein QBC47DRAFT_93848 [Echria macrotheca]|uniref:NACHT-NTPase and P-loop NTPases N-terminal domain-containing protein n=1 Tax=Echria macrotheca TaxID=438768 RepID=A0AAJ0F731_9PEZI|nr:hypothetical protein QBC47DRAFT_93848 [Echria macrotheca]